MPRQLNLSREGDTRDYDLIVSTGNPYTPNALEATSSGFFLRPGHTLLSTPVPKYYESEDYVEGSVLTFYGHKARDLILPILITSESSDDIDAALSEFLRFVDSPSNVNALKFTYTNGSGDTRYTFGRLIMGNAAIPIQYESVNSVSLQLQFRCDDPYWYEEAGETSIRYEGGLTYSASDYLSIVYNGILDLPSRTVSPVSDRWYHRTVTVDLNTGGLPIWPEWRVYDESLSNELGGALELVVILNEPVGWFRLDNLGALPRFVTNPHDRSVTNNAGLEDPPNYRYDPRSRVFQLSGTTPTDMQILLGKDSAFTDNPADNFILDMFYTPRFLTAA